MTLLWTVVMQHRDPKRLHAFSLCIISYACVWRIRGNAKARDISCASSKLVVACTGKACHDQCISVQHNGVQADLVTRADADAATGLAHRCCIGGECNTGDKWAPLAPHD